MEVFDGACAPEVEHILADSNVASSWALAPGDVRKGVFDSDPLSEISTPFGSRLQGSKLN